MTMPTLTTDDLPDRIRAALLAALNGEAETLFLEDLSEPELDFVLLAQMRGLLEMCHSIDERIGSGAVVPERVEPYLAWMEAAGELVDRGMAALGISAADNKE